MQNEQEIKNDQEVTSELEQCVQERNMWKDKCLRVQADFDNFTKRNDKERAQWKTTIQSALLLDFLPVVDDFERALSSVPHDQATPLSEGVNLIYKTVQKLLEKYEVMEIPTAMPFDPEYHEAIMQVADSGKEPGAIVAILQKGYLFKGVVLRPARVSVAQ